MTREQIEAVLKTFQAKSDKEGGHALPEGSNVTFQVCHDGASVSIQKVESVRIDGELLYAKGAKQLTAVVASDVFAVSVEGGGGTPARRPPGFG